MNGYNEGGERRFVEATGVDDTGLLQTLTARERDIVELRYGLRDGCPQTFTTIGRQYSLTPQRIRQIEARAIRKLRHPSRGFLRRGLLDQ
jgi:RNA polymerase primary sigma factor